MELWRKRNLRSGTFCLFATCLACIGCSTPPTQVPAIEKLFPSAPAQEEIPLAQQRLDLYLDGTLSMRGFSVPKSGKYAQLLQDLDLAFSSAWSRDRTRYFRFGSVIEEVRERPFYVAAARENFFLATKEYANTRIDTVFRKSSPGNLTLVLTDLFENNLDIASIQEALRASSFPARASLAIWQWEMPFSGPIFDFDFRNAQGHSYTGTRPIYLLALGPEQSLARLRHGIESTMTVGNAEYLLVSGKLASNPQQWLTVTQTQHLALVREVPGNAQVPAYRVYRPSSCTVAGLSFASQLTARGDNVVPRLTPHPGSYSAELLDVSGANGRWSTRSVGTPEVKISNGPGLSVQIDCATLAGSPLHLLRIWRSGTPEDVVLPDWVARSSASSMQFNAALGRHDSNWGEKTLNLAPLIRGLANTAVDGRVIASAYCYFVKS